MIQREILSVAETPAGVFLLFIDYEAGDIASATGSIHRIDPDIRGGRGTVPELVMSSSDSVRHLWASPQGQLWTASDNGFIATTAPVSWPAATGTHYDAEGSSAPWTVTALPRLAADGLRANVSALWGTGDDDVFAGTYGGHIFHWDGRAWRQTHDAGAAYTVSILGFGGGAPGDVYAVGQQRTLLRFDGQAWLPVPVPRPAANEAFTAVVAQDDGSVLVSAAGNAGRLLHVTAAGATELMATPLTLVDMARLGDRLLFATGGGVAERIGQDIQTIKSTFLTSTVFAGLGRVFFIQPAQDTPSFIDHDPRVPDAPWWRSTF